MSARAKRLNSAPAGARSVDRTRSGRAALLLVLLLAAGVVAGSLLLLGRERLPADAGPNVTPGPRPQSAADARGSGTSRRAAANGGAAPGGGSIEVGAPQAVERPEQSFEGRGRLRGVVEVTRGAFPATWQLVLTPSETLRGTEPGVARTLDFGADVREFELEDLPLAGYELRVEAPGMNTRSHQVLLQEPVTDQYVVVQLVPAGFIDGRVLDEHGQPVAGLAVVLEALPAGTRQACETDPGGAFHLSGVLDGDYRITAGDPELPLDAKELVYRAPSQRVDLRVPALGQVTCRVVDRFGAALEQVSVQGYGPRGASIEGRSDRHGMVELEHLPAGDYRIVGNDEQHGRGRVRFELAAGEHAQVRLVLTQR